MAKNTIKEDIVVWAPFDGLGYRPGIVRGQDDKRGTAVTFLPSMSNRYLNSNAVVPAVREICADFNPESDFGGALEVIDQEGGKFVQLSVTLKRCNTRREMRVSLKRLLPEEIREHRVDVKKTAKEDAHEEDDCIKDACRKAYDQFLDDISEDDDDDGDEDWKIGDPDDGETPKKKAKGKRLTLAQRINQKRQRFDPDKMEGPEGEGEEDDHQEMSEYEKLRLKRIEERKSLFEEMVMASADLRKACTPKPQRRSYGTPRPRAYKIPYSTRTEPIKLRSRHNSRGSSNQSEDGFEAGLWSPRKRRFCELDEGDDDDYQPSKRFHPQRWQRDPNSDFLKPEDVTTSMISNVCTWVGSKVYNQVRGTTCHQCRQKTLDTKTVCRSGRCVGVRGQFCGVCLRNRYGEDILEVLVDPKWECPPCRDVCNCSICRNRRGRCATGIMTGLALSLGYKSVADYLASLKNNKT